MSEIEKKVHWIWRGEQISNRHLVNIYEFFCYNPDYELTIWIDRTKQTEEAIKDKLIDDAIASEISMDDFGFGKADFERASDIAVDSEKLLTQFKNKIKVKSLKRKELISEETKTYSNKLHTEAKEQKIVIQLDARRQQKASGLYPHYPSAS